MYATASSSLCAPTRKFDSSRSMHNGVVRHLKVLSPPRCGAIMMRGLLWAAAASGSTTEGGHDGSTPCRAHGLVIEPQKHGLGPNPARPRPDELGAIERGLSAEIQETRGRDTCQRRRSFRTASSPPAAPSLPGQHAGAVRRVVACYVEIVVAVGGNKACK
jgi:hypothetical protein